MNEYESLSHPKWDCKYHVIFIPKYRREALYGQLRTYLGEVLRRLAGQRESRPVLRSRLSTYPVVQISGATSLR